MKDLPLRIVLAAAFITYLASAPEDIRLSCLQNWTEHLGIYIIIYIYNNIYI